MLESISKTLWGNYNGQPVSLYRLQNSNGLCLEVTDFGATLVSLNVPDKKGQMSDVALGCDDLIGYIKGDKYMGATIGRFANRIAGARFRLGDKEYSLPQNDGANCLHAGTAGLNNVVFESSQITQDGKRGIKFHTISRDGEGGFPGNLEVDVTFFLTPDNELVLNYKAKTDKPTVVNFVNHAYWNLAGQGQPSIIDHELRINADNYTPMGVDRIPTGALESVLGTPFDFLTPKPIGERLNSDSAQLGYGYGYDHNWVLNKKTPKSLSMACSLYEPASGRCMEIWTTEPGLQFYSGNFLDVKGKKGSYYKSRSGCCLETQHFPDSPNQPQFPTTLLHPGEVFNSTTVHKFFTV